MLSAIMLVNLIAPIPLPSKRECQKGPMVHVKKCCGTWVACGLSYGECHLARIGGFPPDAFNGVFAAGRMTEWLEHSREKAMIGRLVRPKSHYAGLWSSLQHD